MVKSIQPALLQKFPVHHQKIRHVSHPRREFITIHNHVNCEDDGSKGGDVESTDGGQHDKESGQTHSDFHPLLLMSRVKPKSVLF